MGCSRKAIVRIALLATTALVLSVAVIILLPVRGSPESLASPLDTSDSLIERGRYLATAGNCVSCHSRPDGPPFAGGVPFQTPFGTIYSTNITPDNETGLGKWTTEDLRRAMHQGIARGGSYLFPAFPYPSFTKVSDADVDAIFAYLRSVTPQRQARPTNGILLQQRWVMRIWNWMFFEPGRYVPQSAKTDQWNRGAYLVEGLGHCSACHTPRNTFMAEKQAEKYSGGTLRDTVGLNRARRWSAVNLTSAKDGLAAWSPDQLAKYLKTGFSARAGTFGPMNAVIVNSLSQLNAEDIRAMTVYLKSLPPYEHAAVTMAPEEIDAGKAIYEARCEKCHLSSGRGGMFSGPALAGSSVVQGNDPAALINVILYGPETPKNVSLGAWETMQSYSDVLSDSEVASVARYVRGSWGNHAGPVHARDVAAQR